MPRYLLSNCIYLRLTSEGAVLLDLRRDEYLALSNEQVAALEPVVFGWPSNSGLRGRHPQTSFNDDRSADAFMSAALERGLVTTDIATGKPAAQAVLAPAETSVSIEDNSLPAKHLPGCIASFARAYALTAASLRFRSLDRIVAKIKLHKSAHTQDTDLPGPLELQSRLSAFMFIRPFFYTANANCLLDSLTLVKFLSGYKLFPTLVLGVRTNPFEAHAWVQDGSCALNCAAEYARGFEPILAI